MNAPPVSLTIEMLDKLADEIRAYTPMPPIMSVLVPEQSRINALMNMEAETIKHSSVRIGFPIYKTDWLPIYDPGRYLTLRRSQFRTRAGFKKSRNYWRWFHREASRKEREVCYVITESIEKTITELAFKVWKEY